MPEPTKASAPRMARLRTLLAYSEISEGLRTRVKHELKGDVSAERAHDIICELSAAIGKARNYPRPGDRKPTSPRPGATQTAQGDLVDKDSSEAYQESVREDPQRNRKDLYE